MSKTTRNVPPSKVKWLRTPKHKHKLLAGEPKKQVVTNWNDKPIAARKEVYKGYDR